MKVNFYIDGFNLFHSIKAAEYDTGLCYKWLNIKKLVEQQLKNQEEIEKIYFFTSYSKLPKDQKRREKKAEKQRRYLRKLKSLGIEIILGQYKLKTKRIGNDFAIISKIESGNAIEIGDIISVTYTTQEEKETDVRIALQIIADCYEGECDKIVVVSGDKDMLPALQMVKNKFGNTHVRVVFPYKRTSKKLKQIADSCYHLMPKNYEHAQFDDDSGKPDGW